MGWTLFLGEGAAPGPFCHTDTASAISAGVTSGVASEKAGQSDPGVGVAGRGIKISPFMKAYTNQGNIGRQRTSKCRRRPIQVWA